MTMDQIELPLQGALRSLRRKKYLSLRIRGWKSLIIGNTMQTTVPVEDAVGMILPHDITEIVQGTFKGPAFKKGHIIRAGGY